MKLLSIMSAMFLLGFIMNGKAQAQNNQKQDGNLKLKSLTVGSGEGPVTSGISTVAYFTPKDESTMLEVMIQADTAWVSYGPQYKCGPVNGWIAISAGHIFKVPWVGPRFTASVPLGKEVKLSGIFWPAIKGWKPSNYEDEFRSVGHLDGVIIDIGRLSLSYYANKYMVDPWNHLPGLSYAVKVRKNVSITPSITWNNNTSEPMFYIGLTWMPKQ